MAGDELITVPEASRELGVTGGAVHIAMTQGRLPFVRMYGRKLIARADLETYRQRSQPAGEKRVGRPRKQEIDPMAADISEGVAAGDSI